MYLKPTTVHTIPVNPSTFGYDKQKLVVNTHHYPAKIDTQQKYVFLFSHSNGFHKETFHPLMQVFIDHLRSLKEYDPIDITFVSWDSRNHGESARLNEGTFTNEFRWADNAMDTMQVIDELELKENYTKLFGVGHSFGATSMLLLEFMFPQTFDGLCVTEPVLKTAFYGMATESLSPVLGSLKRRDEWPSREECKKSLSKKKFFQLLHPDVFDNYVNHGLYETDKGTVKLCCPPEQEHHVFKYYQYDAYTAHKSLRTLMVPTHFIYALDSSFVHPDDAATITDENPKMITLDFVKGTHMVPNEVPEVIVPQIMVLINRTLASTQPKSKL